MIELSTVGSIDDVKRTGFYAGAKQCDLCGTPTPDSPLRISWYKKGDSSGIGKSYNTGYFDDECAHTVIAAASVISPLSGLC